MFHSADDVENNADCVLSVLLKPLPSARGPRCCTSVAGTGGWKHGSLEAYPGTSPNYCRRDCGFCLPCISVLFNMLFMLRKCGQCSNESQHVLILSSFCPIPSGRLRLFLVLFLPCPSPFPSSDSFPHPHHTSAPHTASPQCVCFLPIQGLDT